MTDEVLPLDALPSVEGELLRSPLLEGHLGAAGFAEVGALVLTLPLIRSPSDFHDTVVLHVPLWRSADGTVLAEVERRHLVDTLELWSVLGDGAIVRTVWASRPGGPEYFWLDHDPRQAPPERSTWPMGGLSTQAATPAPADLEAWSHWSRRVDDLPADGVLEAHLAIVQALAATRGAPVVLPPGCVPALNQRHARITTALTSAGGSGAVATMALLTVVQVVAVGVLLFVTSAQLDGLPADDTTATVVALMPLVGGSLGLALGMRALRGGWRGSAATRTTTALQVLAAVGLLAAAAAFEPAAVLPLAAWTGVGLVFSAAIARFVVPWVSDRVAARRMAARVPEPPVPPERLLAPVPPPAARRVG
ncbi:MAG: hypothetical protein H6732_18745 [Alphaproteobacteria bacterium]|nr:hypothetical protein [Alphaproteobacteria bacterium]